MRRNEPRTSPSRPPAPRPATSTSGRSARQVWQGSAPGRANLVATYARQAGTGVDAVTSAAMDNCVAPVGAQTATVQVTITTKPLIPGVLGSFTETAHASATAECGINLGAVC